MIYWVVVDSMVVCEDTSALTAGEVVPAGETSELEAGADLAGVCVAYTDVVRVLVD